MNQRALKAGGVRVEALPPRDLNSITECSKFEGRGPRRGPYLPDEELVNQPTALGPFDEERRMQAPQQLDFPEAPRASYGDSQWASTSKHSDIRPPVVRGIALVATRQLPDRIRSIFPFPLFNAVQSKCFHASYETNDNLVLSAPTGCGKTAVLELAICRLINGCPNGSYKIVYQAPTKSLCAERQRDWQAKFGPLGLNCAELTGDTQNAQLRDIQNATIIITTAEKWDSMTRKWKYHEKLVLMVKLFLIDEVHILKEDRGATLESVVSRMKSMSHNVRFIALCATVPNSRDIASWLGRDSMNTHISASHEQFGEDFRPVQLQKHVCGYQSNANGFVFEKILNGKLTDVIRRWSQRKPIMIFCLTRNSCIETAKLLANWWTTRDAKDRYWRTPRGRLSVHDKELRDTVSSGVAFHHAGLQPQDRATVEKGYLEGNITVICCTSTLAVGVNLPCHMVIIKTTMTCQSNATGGGKEYSDLEIMQMLGRAGRPQFDDSAVAVIMTRTQRVQYYEKMITGQEVLESCLHRNLIDHLNAEIGLGTVSGVASAKKWLSGTFLYVRLMHNPGHYRLDGDVPGLDLDDRLENICTKAITMLEEVGLVKSHPGLHCTRLGDSMARYYLQFNTMRGFLALPPKAKVSEILTAISQATEFKDVRFRSGEKATYKELNKNGSIKFPIAVNLDAPAHKVSLIIQSVLGSIELPTDDSKQKIEYSNVKAIIFPHANRLVRCIIDCKLNVDDAVSVRSALMLARSLGAQAWDDSPLHMKQLEGVGLVSVRKLVAAGIKSIEDIEITDAQRLEMALSRNPPYGTQLQEKAKTVPKLRVSLKMTGPPAIIMGEHVTVKVKADIGFLNEKVPETYQKRAVYVCFLAEISNGTKVHFTRISAKKLKKGQDVLFSANLTTATQSIHAYIMCDDIGGTARHAVLHPDIPATAFSPPKTLQQMNRQHVTRVPDPSKRRASSIKRTATGKEDDEFKDADIGDIDMINAEADGFVDIDNLSDASSRSSRRGQKTIYSSRANGYGEPQPLPNGKWACSHACKDKNSCKHPCCRDGVEKKRIVQRRQESKEQSSQHMSNPKRMKFSMVPRKPSLLLPAVTCSDKTPTPVQHRSNTSPEVRNTKRLHSGTKMKAPNSTQRARRFMDKYPANRMMPTENLVLQPDELEMFDAAYTGGTMDSQLSQLFPEGSGDGCVDSSSYTDEVNKRSADPWQSCDWPEGDLCEPPVLQPSHEHNFSEGSFSKRDKTSFTPANSPAHGPQLAGVSTCQQSMNGFDPGSSNSFDTERGNSVLRRTASAQLREDLDEAVEPPVNGSIFAGMVDGQAREETAGSGLHDLEEWFKTEFGTEQFDYVG